MHAPTVKNARGEGVGRVGVKKRSKGLYNGSGSSIFRSARCTVWHAKEQFITVPGVISGASGCSFVRGRERIRTLITSGPVHGTAGGILRRLSHSSRHTFALAGEEEDPLLGCAKLRGRCCCCCCFGINYREAGWQAGRRSSRAIFPAVLLTWRARRPPDRKC